MTKNEYLGSLPGTSRIESAAMRAGVMRSADTGTNRTFTRDTGAVSFPPATDPDVASYVEKAEALYAQRRARAKFFGSIESMLQEPIWDILLDLFIAHERGVASSIGTACIAACVPPSTALRCIRYLEDNKIVRCWRSENDHRVRNIALTPQSMEMMLRYLNAM